MADQGTASTLVLIAAILQLILSILFALVLGFIVLGLGFAMPFIPDLFPLDIGVIFLVITGVLGVGVLFSFIFMIVWFAWYKTPSAHKNGLIITGIFGLLFAGFLPGLLALIGGIVAPSESEVMSPPPARGPPETKAPTTQATYCPACGNPLEDPSAQFCAMCGAALDLSK